MLKKIRKCKTCNTNFKTPIPKNKINKEKCYECFLDEKHYLKHQ